MLFSLEVDSQTAALPLKLNYKDPNVVDQLTSSLYQIFSKVPDSKEMVVVCVGTDRSTGDSLGPLVGTQLQKLLHPKFHLFGTLDEPVHAVNLKEILSSIQQDFKDPFIVAIDACLGQVNSVGCIQIGDGPIKPGAGVHKELPAIGHIHITGIVNVGGFMEYFVLQNTRLSLVMGMAKAISRSLYLALVNADRVKATPFLQLD